MRPLLKRNILVALICALPAVLGVESAIGHSSGGGSSSGAGSSGGHGGGNFPSGHSSTGSNSAHMSGASLGGRFATNPVTQFTGTGDAASGRFVHKGAIRTSPDQSTKQRQFDTGYVPSNWQGNDQWRRKRHRYHHLSSP
jgi:hypothetical protein